MATKFTKFSNTITLITLDEPAIQDFAKERNLALSKVTTPWAFFLDQDEELSQELEGELKSFAPDDTFLAYAVRRTDYLLGRKLSCGETAKVKLTRLIKLGTGQWVRPVHEVWESKGRIGELGGVLIHHPHASIASFLHKIDLYSELEANYRHSLSHRSNLLKIALYPLAKFVQNYLLRLGMLDGVPGLVMAIMMSFHSYLTWTKLYLLSRRQSAS